MSIAVLIIHILACVALILVVLLQAGKGASMGAAFGGASQTVFGSAGATTFLAKMTTVVAILFMLTSLGLAYLSSGAGPSSLMDKTAPAAQQQQAAPAPAAQKQQAAPAPADAKPAQPASQSKSQ